MSKSLNVAMIIGNVVRDPEMRYTPTGKAVTSFSVATNREWTAQDGAAHEEAEFHNVVAWQKLGEICNQLLKKGTKVYVSGRLQTRTWDDQQGLKHYRTEIVADEMIVLTSKYAPGEWEAAHSEGTKTPESPKPAGTPDGARPDGSEDVKIDETTGMPF